MAQNLPESKKVGGKSGKTGSAVTVSRSGFATPTKRSGIAPGRKK